MISKKRRNLIFLEAAILTLIIYLSALILNGYLDNMRISYLGDQNLKNEIKIDNFYVLDNFANIFLKNKCEIKRNLLFNRQRSLIKFGNDLSNFGSLFLKKNENVLILKQKEYYQDQLNLYLAFNNYNSQCKNKVIPIFYFFNSFSTSLHKQSLILEQFSLNNRNKTIVFSFDINFNKEFILNEIKKKNNITFSPFIIIGNKTTRTLPHNNNNIVSLNSIQIEYLKLRGK